MLSCAMNFFFFLLLLPNSSLHFEQRNFPLTDKTRLLLLLIVVRMGDLLKKKENEGNEDLFEGLFIRAMFRLIMSIN